MPRVLGWCLRLLIRSAAPQKAPSTRLLVMGASGVLVCVMVLTGWMVWDARGIALQHAAQSRDNVAAAIEHDIDRTIELYDLSLQAVVHGMRLPGIEALSPDLRKQVLFDRAATARHLGAMMVLDDQGQVTLAASEGAATGENFRDAEFFRVHRDRSQTGLYLSLPFKSGRDGEWSIALSRRVEHPDGNFAGVVFGTLRLAFFAQLFGLIDSGADGAITLFRADGRLLYRAPFEDRLIGRDFSKWGLFHEHPQSKTGTLGLQSKIDGIERFYSYRRLDGLPLVLVVGVAQTTVLGPWQQKAVAIVVCMLALSIVVVGLGWALIGELRRRGDAERIALDSERRYRFLTEHSFDMIVRFDPHTQQRTYISPACQRLYGYEPEEAMALSAEEVIHPDDLAGVREALAELEEHPHHPPILYRGRRKDGAYIWVEASLTRLQDPDSGRTEIISVVRDVSERMRYQTALCQAKDEADSANHAKSSFLATMSHELRTPLNAIIGFAEIMQHEIMGPIGNAQYRSYVGDIHASGTHLLQLINDILDLTKAEAGKLDLHEEIVDLREVVRSVARVSKVPGRKAGLSIRVDLARGLPSLRGDERKVRQVLFNLIGNAIKFTPAGGQIEVSARFGAKTGFKISVSDNGIGIAAADLPRVLEPFVQLESSLSRQHAGTGLGLPTAKALVELHGGVLALQSTVGRGTIATVIFPPGRAVADGTPTLVRPAA